MFKATNWLTLACHDMSEDGYIMKQFWGKTLNGFNPCTAA